MLITQLKDKETLNALTDGKVFLIRCHGCKEVGFPEEEMDKLQKEWIYDGKITGVMVTDYICNPTELALRVKGHMAEIEEADMILVASCGVGVQTAAEFFEDKKVLAACDTIELPGYQGVTPSEYDCGQCGQCFLNLTGGICPITACSKSLVNGPCGGTKDGMCEVDPTMECGWERIVRRLKEQGRLDVLRCKTQMHDFSTDEKTKECKESAD